MLLSQFSALTLALACPASSACGPDAAGARAALAGRVGQMVVSRIDGAAPGRALLARVRAGRVGGVVLFAHNARTVSGAHRLVARLQTAAADGGRPPLFVFVDQEGGAIRRFSSLPPRAAPREIATRGRRSAMAQGRATGLGLRRAGVNVDLAPVVDVPGRSGSFLRDRAFGATAGTVAANACGFAAGLASARVLPTLKHFPGLGGAPANTDFDAATVRLPLGELRASYEPYRLCGRGVLVMVASAVFPAIDAGAPAVLSSALYRRELRGAAGYRGATISDDLESAAIDPIPQVAVKAARAGLDLQLYARSEAAADLAQRRLAAAVRSGALSAARVTDALDRIAALKAIVGG
jgi:beta-N-acetylhexosaminidase